MVEHGLQTEIYNGQAFPVQGYHGFHHPGGYARSGDSTNGDRANAGTTSVRGAGFPERRDLDGDQTAVQLPALSAAAVFHHDLPPTAPSHWAPGAQPSWTNDGALEKSPSRISTNVLLTDEVCFSAVGEPTLPELLL